MDNDGSLALRDPISIDFVKYWDLSSEISVNEIIYNYTLTSYTNYIITVPNITWIMMDL